MIASFRTRSSGENSREFSFEDRPMEKSRKFTSGVYVTLEALF